MTAPNDAVQIGRRVAREAFDAGVRNATQPRAERDRHRLATMDYGADLIAAHVAAEVAATPPAPQMPPPAGGVPIQEQIAAVQDAEDYRITSLGWRAGRVGHSPAREKWKAEGLAAALATLKALQDGRHG